MGEEKKCVWCDYARMKTDICGIYCTGGFENTDGTCDHFKEYKEKRKRNPSNEAFAKEEL